MKRHCEYNNKDEDNNLNTLNDKNKLRYSALNIPGLFWRMDEFENVSTQVIKSKFEEKIGIFNLV